MVEAKDTERQIDHDLMAKIQQGDMVAFNTIVGRYKDRLMNAVTRMLGAHEEAEDIVQETFFRVYQHRGAFDFRHCFSTWIYTIAFNLARNELRKRKRFKFYDIFDLQGKEAEISVEMELPSNLPAAIEKAMNMLPDKYKLAFILRDIQELPYEEVAKVMNIPLGTVKSRVNRARAILREKLRPRVEEYNALSKGALLPVQLL
jgi:RNA polymerase sigma-70 factor (ECF subfamily)